MANQREARVSQGARPPFPNEPRESQPRPGRPSARDDFYGHVNYTWLHETSLPPSESRWNVFDILRHETAQRLRTICEGNPSHKRRHGEHLAKGSNMQLVQDFYTSGMDMDARKRAGIAPLHEYLTGIEKISEAGDVMEQIARLHLINVTPFFDFMFAEDRKKAGNNAYYVWQGGLGMPNRDYYLSAEEGMEEIRVKYKQYIANTFRLAGRSETDATKAADGVFAIELALAQATLPPAEERQADKNYHKFTLAQAQSEFSDAVDFGKYFTALGVPGIEDFIIGQPDFIKTVGTLMQTVSIEDIKDYLTFTLLNSTADALSEDFGSASFAFYGQALGGKTEQKPLWERVIQDMNGSILNQAIGPLYCDQYFNMTDKARVMDMVGDITAAFAERIEGLEWMGEETKKRALEKLANVTFKMGFPDTWIDVSGLNISSEADSSYAQNILRATEFSIRRRLGQLSQPFDRNEWRMQPTVVNASADLKRSVTFPAAILQPPFYTPGGDEAYNYGAIGAVIGHELSHFFDDQGSKFDVNGNLNNWWTSADKTQFTERAQRFVAYYGHYEVNGLPVNGELTLGENIADIAGVAVAYDAFQKHLRSNGTANVVAEGMTPEQRFFTGFARMWASKITPEAALERIKRDPHSPDTIRVNAALSAFQPFYEAFGVEEGDGMYVSPEDRPKIW